MIANAPVNILINTNNNSSSMGGKEEVPVITLNDIQMRFLFPWLLLHFTYTRDAWSFFPLKVSQKWHFPCEICKIKIYPSHCEVEEAGKITSTPCGGELFLSQLLLPMQPVSSVALDTLDSTQ